MPNPPASQPGTTPEARGTRLLLRVPLRLPSRYPPTSGSRLTGPVQAARHRDTRYPPTSKGRAACRRPVPGRKVVRVSLLSARRAPGVGDGGVACLPALAVQARRDDDDLVDLGLVLQLQQSLGYCLWLAGHHAPVLVAAGAEVRGAGQLSDSFRPQRLADAAADVLDGERPGRLEVDHGVRILARKGQHRHGRIRLAAVLARGELAAVGAQCGDGKLRA